MNCAGEPGSLLQLGRGGARSDGQAAVTLSIAPDSGQTKTFEFFGIKVCRS